MKILNAQYQHPFTCIVAGPTRAGKSTFVKKFILNHSNFVNVIFDYIIIVLGTEAKENITLSSLVDETSLTQNTTVEVIELKKLFPDKKWIEEFPPFFEDMFKNKKKLNGCIIFDDLMSEMAECDILLDLYTKKSSHFNISIINITQNVFFKGSGKRASDNVTIYRNTHVLVIFKNPMDNTIMTIIAKRIGSNRYKDLIKMLQYIVDKYRYVVIQGNFNSLEQLRFSSDIFATEPFPHQKVFQLD